MVSDSSYRKSFIDSSIKVARLYGFQGLDLSWVNVNTSSDMYNLGILFGEWRAAINLEARNSSQAILILTARVDFFPLTGSPLATIYPIESIQQYLNWVHVISSEYFNPQTRNLTSAYAALYDPNSVANTDRAVRGWIDGGLSANKLVLCLPHYGYAWTLVNPEDNHIGAQTTGPAITANGLSRFEEIKSYIRQYGSNARVMYNDTYVVNYCTIGTTWIGFDDVEAIRAKVS